MFEKLKRIRSDLSRARERQTEANKKVRELEIKLKDAEAAEIVDMVAGYKFTPEELKQFLDRNVRKNENKYNAIAPFKKDAAAESEENKNADEHN